MCGTKPVFYLKAFYLIGVQSLVLLLCRGGVLVGTDVYTDIYIYVCKSQNSRKQMCGSWIFLILFEGASVRI